MLKCLNCGHLSAEANDTKCTKCQAQSGEHINGIEVIVVDQNVPADTEILGLFFFLQVGHAFLLGDTYSKRQKAHWLKDGQPVPMQMGCYGIGMTRLIGAAVEKLSTDTALRWPFALAPFSICIIPPEKRSKAFNLASHHLDEIYHRLNSISGLKDSILVDDRIRMNIGDRYRDARRFVCFLGYSLFQHIFFSSFCFKIHKIKHVKTVYRLFKMSKIVYHRLCVYIYSVGLR